MPLISPRPWAGLEHSVEEAEPAIRDPPFGAEPRWALERRPVSELHEGGVGEKEIEEPADRGPGGLAQVQTLTESRHDELPHLAVHALLDGAVERLLGGKVVVEARDADAGVTRDVPHRGAGQSLAAEDGHACAEHALPGPIAALPGGPAGPARPPSAGAHATQLFIVRTRASATSR